jgi:hypothetical protein
MHDVGRQKSEVLQMLLKVLIAIFALSPALTFSEPMAVPDVRPAKQVKPAKSRYFLSTGAGVNVEKGVPGAYFGLVLKILRPIPKESTMEVEFENPPDPQSSFRSVVELPAKSDLVLRSPVFVGITNKKSYLARVTIRDKRGRVHAVHEQWIRFDLPQQVIEAFQIKLLTQ